MKPFILLLLLFVSLSFVSTDIFKYTLDKNQKFENTFSFDVNENSTVHLLIVKNKDTKMYDLIPFYMNDQQAVKQLETVSFEEVPKIISYHSNGDTFTMIGYQNKTLDIMDYSIDSGTFSKESWEDYDYPSNIFKENNRTHFLEADKKGEAITVTTIENSSTTNKKEIEVKEENQKIIKSLFKSESEVVDTEDFIENGSISDVQMYLENNIFFLVENDDEKEDEVSLTTININEGSIKNFAIEIPEMEKIRDNNSQIIDGKLFTTFLGKDDFTVAIYNSNDGKMEKKLTLNEELSKLKGIKNKKANFLKESGKMKNRPTIAVNETIDGNYAVAVSNVDKNSYKYNNWWFLHQMMWQQQMMMNNMARPSGFGPNPSFLEEQNPDYYFTTLESSSIKFVLNKDLKILENVSEESKKVFVDKEKFTKQLQQNKNVHNSSIGFLKDELRYIYTDKKEDVVFIKTKPIKRRNVEALNLDED